MILLASHKTVKQKLADNPVDMVILIGSSKGQLDALQLKKRKVAIYRLIIDGNQPGKFHSRGQVLCNTSEVLQLVKLLAEAQGRNVLISDYRGKGVCTAAAAIYKYIETGGNARVAATFVSGLHPRANVNTFITRLFDVLCGASLTTAVESHCKFHYHPFKPVEWAQAEEGRRRAEAAAADKAKKAAEKAKKAEKPAEPVAEPEKEKPAEEADTGVDGEP